jgi:hypothetical protein
MPLKAQAAHGVAQQVVQGFQLQQAAVAHIHLGRLDQAPAQVAAPGAQAALQVAVDKVPPPVQALGVVPCQQAVRKTTAQPQRADGDTGDGGLQEVDQGNVEVGHAPGQSFAGLAQKSSAAEPCSKNCPLRWPACRLSSMMPRKISNIPGARWISSRMTSLPCWARRYVSASYQPQAIKGALQVQEHRAAGPVLRQGAGQRGFAHLAWPQEHHSGGLEQLLAEGGFELATYHHCFFNC